LYGAMVVPSLRAKYINFLVMKTTDNTTIQPNTKKQNKQNHNKYIKSQLTTQL